MKRFTILTIACLALALTSCSVLTAVSPNLTKGSGPLTTKTFDAGGFDGIVLESSPSLVVSVDDEEAVSVEAQENLLDLMTAEVREGTLYLGVRPDASYSSAEPVTFYVTADNLDHIRLSSSGSASVADLQAGDFEAVIDSSGSLELAGLTAERAALVSNSSGNMTIEALVAGSLNAQLRSSGNIDILSGQVKEQTVTLEDGGNYRARGMSSETAIVNVNSSGSAEIAASDSLDGQLTSSGGITYYGDPTVSVSATSSGVVRQGR